MILGDTILTSSDIRTIITQKFIFLKIFSKENVIQNIIGYLYESPSRKHLYHETFRKILSIWCTQGSIANTSYEQHLYLTKFILVCKSYMVENDKDKLSTDVINYVLKGVEAHLSSPIESMRLLGMIVGENLMNEFSESENKLKFEYVQTNLTTLLQSLTKPPKSQLVNDDAREDFHLFNEEEKTVVENKDLQLKITQTNDDSDDDLQPYDLSNDTIVTKTKQPAYLRDCLDGLIYSEDPEKVEMCLRCVENLCKNYHFELKDICVELVKILLHKSNNYGIEKFDEYRMKGLIEVTCHYPIEVAQYLTNEFYEQNYTITQRIDILHVLATSVQKLSNPSEEVIEDRRLNNLLHKQKFNDESLIAINKQLYTEESSNNWKEIVKKRIELKTKRKTQSKFGGNQKLLKENKLGDSIGYFFFPLIKPYDL